MDKKGSAHLEMILAFTIFLVVVVFLLVYIKPLETSKLSEVAVISLKDSFVDYTSVNLTIVFVNGTTSVRNAPEGVSSKNWTLREIGDDNTYYVYFSDEFTTNGSREVLNIGSISTQKVISNTSLIRMQNKYYSDYSGLKEDLRIPLALDFEIYTLEGEYNMTRGDIGEVDIIAKRYVLPVLNSGGDLINREFVFRAW